MWGGVGACPEAVEGTQAERKLGRDFLVIFSCDAVLRPSLSNALSRYSPDFELASRTGKCRRNVVMHNLPVFSIEITV